MSISKYLLQFYFYVLEPSAFASIYKLNFYINVEIQKMHRKTPLHQQKFLVVSVLSNSPWLPRNLKTVQNETNKHFSAGTGNTKVNILALTAEVLIPRVV